MRRLPHRKGPVRRRRTGEAHADNPSWVQLLHVLAEVSYGPALPVAVGEAVREVVRAACGDSWPQPHVWGARSCFL